MSPMPFQALALTLPLALALSQDARRLHDEARSAGAWIASLEQPTERGLAWPVDAESGRVEHSLYAGTPGIVLFFAELGRALGEERWSDMAVRGGRELAAVARQRGKEMGAGLWTGLAGVAFTLETLHQRSGKSEFREAAVAAVETLHELAGDGPSASFGEVTDVISGDAGVGLFLLWSTRAMDRPQDRELALRIGTHLLEVGEETEHGTSWAMSASYPTRMPGFSHGTAGVATFLARLGEQRFLSAARSGAAHLVAIADRSVKGFRVYHHAPGGEELFYLGWCHGPAGTARLFRALGSTELEERAALAIRESGIPAKRTPGFWNNVGPCCGSVGVGAFFLDLYERTGDEEHLAFARELTADLLARARRDDAGTSWPQAEHRVEPELVVAQTGYMQGAAGIGLWLLRMDAPRERRLRFPGE